jgi:hypothetical protein
MLTIASEKTVFADEFESNPSARRKNILRPSAAPLAILSPPVVEDGLFECLAQTCADQATSKLFTQSRIGASAMILFAKNVGLLNQEQIDLLGGGLTASSYSDLYTLYGASLDALSNKLNQVSYSISGAESPSFLYFDAFASNERKPVLGMASELVVCQIPLCDDEEIDLMTDSLLSLLSAYNVALRPEDCLDMSWWAKSEGEALDKLKVLMGTSDMRVIAETLVNKSEAGELILADAGFDDIFELDEVEGVCGNLEFIDDNYEPIPDHLSYKNKMSCLDITKQLLSWHQSGDARLSHPRVLAIKKGLSVFQKIRQQNRQSSLSDSLYVNHAEIDGCEAVLTDCCSQLISYGLRFEERLFNDLYQQLMEVGEEPSLYLNLAPIAHSQLYAKLLNMAQAQGVLTLLESSESKAT